MVEIQIELVALILVAAGAIASHVRLAVRMESEAEKLRALDQKQKADHADIQRIQENRDAAIWDQMAAVRNTLQAVGEKLGKVDGKLDFMMRNGNDKD